jgi:hypothetical protein
MDHANKEILGSKLDMMEHIPVIGTTSGMLLPWKSSVFSIIQTQKNTCSITTDLWLTLDNSIIRITDVYGPTSHNREIFFQELIHAKPPDDKPWLL